VFSGFIGFSRHSHKPKLVLQLLNANLQVGVAHLAVFERSAVLAGEFDFVGDFPVSAISERFKRVGVTAQTGVEVCPKCTTDGFRT
jgi:hypothetical protein